MCQYFHSKSAIRELTPAALLLSSDVFFFLPLNLHRKRLRSRLSRGSVAAPQQAAALKKVSVQVHTKFQKRPRSAKAHQCRAADASGVKRGEIQPLDWLRGGRGGATQVKTGDEGA